MGRFKAKTYRIGRNNVHEAIVEPFSISAAVELRSMEWDEACCSYSSRVNKANALLPRTQGGNRYPCRFHKPHSSRCGVPNPRIRVRPVIVTFRLVETSPCPSVAELCTHTVLFINCQYGRSSEKIRSTPRPDSHCSCSQFPLAPRNPNTIR